jgi:hypothetical protein
VFIASLYFCISSLELYIALRNVSKLSIELFNSIVLAYFYNAASDASLASFISNSYLSFNVIVAPSRILSKPPIKNPPIAPTNAPHGPNIIPIDAPVAAPEIPLPIPVHNLEASFLSVLLS